MKSTSAFLKSRTATLLGVAVLIVIGVPWFHNAQPPEPCACKLATQPPTSCSATREPAAPVDSETDTPQSVPLESQSSAHVAEDTKGCATPPLQPNELVARCPDEDDYLRQWLLLRQSRASQSPKRTLRIVIVGVNKGYTIGSILTAAGVGNATREMVARAVFDHSSNSGVRSGIKDMCGACCDCGHLVEYGPGVAKVPASSSAPRGDDVDIDIEIFGFEPAKANYDFLVSLWTNWRPPNPRHRVKIHLVNAAVSSSSGDADFPQMPFGIEVGSLSRQKKYPTVKVRVTTLNEALPAHVDHIDVLLTDTEGFDYKVGDGASRFLDKKQVSMYVFELHGKDRKPIKFFEKLFAARYQCFFPVEYATLQLPPITDVRKFELPRTMVNITGDDCWRPQYKGQRGWKNAVCIDPSVPELLSVFTKLTRTPRRLRQCVVAESLRGHSAFSHEQWQYLSQFVATANW